MILNVQASDFDEEILFVRRYILFYIIVFPWFQDLERMVDFFFVIHVFPESHGTYVVHHPLFGVVVRETVFA